MREGRGGGRGRTRERERLIGARRFSPSSSRGVYSSLENRVASPPLARISARSRARVFAIQMRDAGDVSIEVLKCINGKRSVGGWERWGGWMRFGRDVPER